MSILRTHSYLMVASILVAGTAMGCSAVDNLQIIDFTSECENLWPGYCMMPWPSSRYLTEDPTTNTGWRVDYPDEAFPTNKDDAPFDASPYRRMDGFPVTPQILMTFGAPVDGGSLPSWQDIGASLADDCPTLLVDMATGERVAHFAEFDVRAELPDEIVMYIRPATRLQENRRYAVGIRGLEWEGGGPVEPSEAFVAIRDGIPTDATQLEERRPGLDETLVALESAGAERETLIQAWDFHTASGEALWGGLLFMRDDAMARIGVEGLGCTITEVREGVSEHIAREILGTITTPTYVDSAYPPAFLVRDDEGLPAYQGDLEVEFRAIVPTSLAQEGAAPGYLVTYGHGLMNNDSQITYDWQQWMADELGLVLVATNYTGLSSDDMATDAAMLSDLREFPAVPERLMQGIINQLVLTRTMTGVCSTEEAFQVGGHTVFDPDTPMYFGGSGGAINGTATLALSPDWDRGLLHVGGGVWPLLQGRSTAFEPFEMVYSGWYTHRIDRELYWSVMGHLWEQVDAVTYAPHLLAGPLPGCEPKQVLYQLGVNDSLVSNVASDIVLRTAGLPLIRPSAREVWGLEDAPATPIAGSAAQYWDLGVTAIPVGNTPPVNNDVHYGVRETLSCMAQMEAFLKPGGQVIDACDGPCDPE